MLDLRAQASGVTFQLGHLGWSDPPCGAPTSRVFPRRGRSLGNVQKLKINPPGGGEANSTAAARFQ